MIKKFANVITLAITLLALAGCGGGGGDESGYQGKTAPAALATSNAAQLSVDVMDGIDTFSQLGSVAKTVPGSGAPDNAVELRSLSGIIERSVSSMVDKPALAKTVAGAVSGTHNGYSGSFSYTGTADPATGKFSATFTYNAYQETAASSIMSGSISISGYYAVQRGGLDRLTIVIPALYIAPPNSDSGFLSTIKGRMSIVNGADKALTFSMVFIDGSTHHTYWYKDFSIVESGSITISGTFFHPVHGYVTITTLTPISSTLTAYGYPDAGQILFTGSNGSKARFTYTGSGWSLEVDAAGTGNYDAVNFLQ